MAHAGKWLRDRLVAKMSTTAVNALNAGASVEDLHAAVDLAATLVEAERKGEL
jgi:hypothetical protein